MVHRMALFRTQGHAVLGVPLCGGGNRMKRYHEELPRTRRVHETHLRVVHRPVRRTFPEIG